MLTWYMQPIDTRNKNALKYPCPIDTKKGISSLYRL